MTLPYWSPSSSSPSDDVLGGLFSYADGGHYCNMHIPGLISRGVTNILGTSNFAYSCFLAPSLFVYPISNVPNRRNFGTAEKIDSRRTRAHVQFSKTQRTYCREKIIGIPSKETFLKTETWRSIFRASSEFL